MAVPAKQHFEKFRADVTKRLHEPNKVNDALGKLESKTGVDRFFVVLGLVGVAALYMIFGHFAELVCNVVGFLYPAYMSIKAVESSQKADDTQWLTYWIIFALLNVLEFGEETITGYFPFYWLCKCAFLVYLYLPSTMGAQKAYQRFVKPLASRFIHNGGGSSFASKTVDSAREHVQEFSQKFQ